MKSKYLAPDGTLQEGIALTEQQIALREQIMDFVHQKICGGGIHNDWSRRHETIRCEEIANFFITKFSVTPLPETDFSAEIRKAEIENEPITIDNPDVPQAKTESAKDYF